MDMEWLFAIFLLIMGVVLLALEVAVVPGFGVVGIGGLVAVTASVAYAFCGIGTAAGWLMLFVAAASACSLIIWAVRSRSLDKLSLKSTIGAVLKDYNNRVKPGDEGRTHTRLALVGEAIINSDLVEVTSIDGFVEEGVAVVVEKVVGNTIYVKRK